MSNLSPISPISPIQISLRDPSTSRGSWCRCFQQPPQHRIMRSDEVQNFLNSMLKNLEELSSSLTKLNGSDSGSSALYKIFEIMNEAGDVLELSDVNCNGRLDEDEVGVGVFCVCTASLFTISCQICQTIEKSNATRRELASVKQGFLTIHTGIRDVLNYMNEYKKLQLPDTSDCIQDMNNIFSKLEVIFQDIQKESNVSNLVTYSVSYNDLASKFKDVVNFLRGHIILILMYYLTSEFKEVVNLYNVAKSQNKEESNSSSNTRETRKFIVRK